MEKSVDFIFISYNAKDKIQESLQSFREHTHVPHKVYVVDNHSTDGSVEYLRTLDWITLIENKQNLGVSKACNIGIKAGSGYYVVILPSDLVFTPNWLEPMLELLEADPKIAIVGNRQVSKLNTLFTAGRTGTNKNNVIGRDDGAGEENDPDRYNLPVECVFLAGASTVFKREIFDVIGLFDENYFYGCEDNDIGFQARYLGYKSVYCPSSVVIHDHGSSIGTLNDNTRKQLISTGEQYFLRKWAHFMDDDREFRRDMPIVGYTIPSGIENGKVLVATIVDKECEVKDAFLDAIDSISYSKDLLRYCFVTNWCGMPRYSYELNRKEAPGFMPCRSFASRKILNGEHTVATKFYPFAKEEWSAKESIGNLLLLRNIFCEKMEAGCYEYLFFVEPNAGVNPKILSKLVELCQDIVVFETDSEGRIGYLVRREFFVKKDYRQGIWGYFDFYNELVTNNLKIAYVTNSLKVEPFTVFTDLLDYVKKFEKLCLHFESLIADLKVRGVFQQQKLLRLIGAITEYSEQSKLSSNVEERINKYMVDINSVEEQLVPLKGDYVDVLGKAKMFEKELKAMLPMVFDILDKKCTELEELFRGIDEKFDFINENLPKG